MVWFGFETTSRLSWGGLCVSLAALSLTAGAAPGDSDVGAPPAHLPRFVWECEAGPGFSACGVWIWQGSSYSASWSNGETGRLTVENGNSRELIVHRTDTAGTFMGLTAAYTGTWDGARFTDGKLTLGYKGATNAGGWTGVPETTPVIHTTFGTVQTVNTDEVYGVGRRPGMYYNWYTAELTGYAIHSQGMAGSGVTTAIDDFRARGEAPMKPGERRLIDLRSVHLQPDYEKGRVYFPGSAIAAIYADGSTFGDRKVLAAMIDYRRSMITALTGIGATLCTLGTQKSSVPDIATALDKQHASQDARGEGGKAPRGAAYAYVQKSLSARGNGRLPANQVIKRTWDQVDKLRSGLADPVKDSSGQLAIPSVTALECNLS